MIEINLNNLQKEEKRIHVKGTATRKAHYRKIKGAKTAVEADAEVEGKLTALREYKEAAARTNKWIAANPDRHVDVGETNNYTVSDYDVINTALRDDFTEADLSDMMIGDQIKSISSFIKDAPKFTGTVYRGMGFNLDKESSANQYYKFIDDVMKFDVITIKPFTSTSQDKDKASEFIGKSTGKDFGKPGGIFFEIKSKNGVALDGAAEFPVEREVLFNKDAKFKIIDYHIDPDTKTYHIKLEEL